VFESPFTENMKIIITCRHESLTEGLRTHIEDKIHRVEKYLGKIREAHVILNFEKRRHLCEINLYGKSLTLSSAGSSHDMYQSIDVALDKLERQVVKVKEKQGEHHREGKLARVRSVVHHILSPAEKDEESVVVRSKKYAVKPMTTEEAALQLTASRDEFLVFSNAETGKTNVVYKRKDSHIGLIEPEY
jgi:putative sigma-54 modulation protein